ncbi:hypothetical protein [Streptomyces sp. NBC_01244]|uniref:hypothetical protein n=1 Tax=Streptomyces sp. NBC_01244 TaxID=2903797 RepID=UPI002E129E89|nr:hypothetical protein OG247_01310 [Streptomyces sp. NBC_01244]
MAQEERNVSQDPPEARPDSTERPRIRQAVALHGAATSEQAPSGQVFVSQPAPAEPAPQSAAEPAPTRLAGRARRRSRPTAQARPARPTATPTAPVSTAVAEGPGDGGSTRTSTAAAAPTTAPPRAAADGSTPPTRQAAGGSGGQGGRPLMAAAAIAGAVLVSVPLVVSQRSDAEQTIRAVGDITASVPVAMLGERGGASWPSAQGGTGEKSPEPAERLRQPASVLPSKTTPGSPRPVDTSVYQPPVITPAGEKAIEKTGAEDRTKPGGKPDGPPGTTSPGRNDDAGGRKGGRGPGNTDSNSDSGSPRTFLAASNSTADPAAGPDSGTRVRTLPAAAPPTANARNLPAPTPPTANARNLPAPTPPTANARNLPAPTPPTANARNLPAPVPPPTAKQGQTKVLRGTYVIKRGQSVSTNRISMTMQRNGNLVIFDAKGRARWSAGTSGRGDRAVFQGDGNLVVLAADGKTVWSTRTDGNPGAKLILQNDGNVTIQAAGGRFLWGSGTQY